LLCTLIMPNHSHASRLVTAAGSASALCAAAGVIAFTGPGALKYSSALLVLAVVVALVGYAYADNRGLGWAALALVAATLPLFGLLYAIGAMIMNHLGPVVAGGCLVALGIVSGALTLAVMSRARLGGAVRRGAPPAPSER
ncbi:MAG TPA: hypothetical protein VGL19_01300, partial [Polyangiaceae bacterium]